MGLKKEAHGINREPSLSSRLEAKAASKLAHYLLNYLMRRYQHCSSEDIQTKSTLKPHSNHQFLEETGEL